eukprot:4130655-Pyramimonas_sp.AAC.1
MELAGDIKCNSGSASPCVFKRETRNMWLTAHGGDFTLLGSGAESDMFEGEIETRFQVKLRGRFGPGLRREEDQSMRISTWILDWKQD